MRAVRPLLTDLSAAARAPGAGALALALVVQALFWTLATPGPALAGAPRTIGAASWAVGWTVALLLLVPATWLTWRRAWPPSLRGAWGRGDARFAAPATALLAALLILGMAFGTRLPEVQATYPWPGDWPGRSLAHLLAWAALYAAYYVAFEWFYRGFLLRTLEPAWGLAPAIWLQTAASTLVHLGKPLPEVLGAIPFGLLAGVLAVRGRSLWWPILLHLALGLATDVGSLVRQGWWLP